MKGYVTINTDASFHQNSNLGGYAFWIVCDSMRLVKSGLLKSVTNPLDAEIQAIANALSAFYNQNVPEISTLIINTDCRAAMSAINGKSSAKDWASALHARSTIHKLKERYGITFYYKFKHVKGHSGTKTPRKFVNDFCDRQSRSEIHKVLNNNLR